MAKPLGLEINGSWKNVLLGVLITALLTSTTGWFAFGQNTVKKSELEKLERSVVELTKSVNDLRTTVAVLNDRMAREEANHDRSR